MMPSEHGVRLDILLGERRRRDADAEATTFMADSEVDAMVLEAVHWQRRQQQP
jgi:hypothetical protein